MANGVLSPHGKAPSLVDASDSSRMMTPTLLQHGNPERNLTVCCILNQRQQ